MLELKSNLHQAKEEELETVSKIKEELMHEDEATRRRIQELQLQVNQVDAFFKNHASQFLKYDAVINGQASRTDELYTDFVEIRGKAVAIDKHEGDLALMDKNLRDLIMMVENQVVNHEQMMRNL